jgi:muramoyltetrapeptide carboxypeptidase
MAFNSIPEIIEDIRNGRMVVILDDEDRENEGDIVMAAEKVTPEAVNFMVREARGLLCLTLTEQRTRQLGLKPMVSDNTSPYHTNFTVSIEAAEGVTTGISAHDRARTIQVAVARHAGPTDITMPGHIFPLTAQPGGVLVRAGHTEAGCDLAALAGLEPAAALIEILDEDGSMARRPQLEVFAQRHGLKIGTIADLIRYRQGLLPSVRGPNAAVAAEAPSYDIRLVAPSGYPHNPESMRLGLQRLEAAGHRVHGRDVLTRRHLRFAGTDAERAADINALADPANDVPDIVLAIRGGYGAHPVLPLLHYDALRERLAASPPVFVGHSDFTAIQCALWSRAGLPSLGGPMLGADFGAPTLDALTWDAFFTTLASDEVTVEWASAADAPVVAEGTLWGGNLAMLASLAGTPYLPSIDGGLLFVEDVAEPPFRIERMLYQLLHAGVLARQSALLVGDFTNCRVADYDNGYDLDAAFDRVAQAARIPLVRGLPFGHAAAKFSLPFGVPARLDSGSGRARLSWRGHPRPKTP